MSFRATITDPENHNTWFRAVHFLSTINESITFTLTENDITLSALNMASTSLCKVIFTKNFFSTLEFVPIELLYGESGLKIITDSEKKSRHIYCFKTNGRHLTTIFRRPEGGDFIKTLTIGINNGASCPDSLVNRLLVLVEMNSLLTKEYSPQFEPVDFNPIVVDLQYKRRFLDVFGSRAKSPHQEPLSSKLVETFMLIEKELSESMFDIPSYIENNEDNTDDMDTILTSDDEINYFCCNQLLLRNFFDNCNSNNTEEVKFEIGPSKFTITAFTNAIRGKNDDVLKNVFSMSNQFNISSLEYHCLFRLINDDHTGVDNSNKSITFKLKDFKNFFYVSQSLKQSNNESPFGNVNIWFRQHGDPIVVEMRKKTVSIELALVTDSDGSNVIDTTYKPAQNISPIKPHLAPSNVSLDSRRTSPLKATDNIPREIHNSRDNSNELHISTNTKRSLFVNNDDDDESDKEAKELGVFLAQHYGSPNKEQDIVNTSENGLASRNHSIIGWGKRPINDDGLSNDNEDSSNRLENDESNERKRSHLMKEIKRQKNDNNDDQLNRESTWKTYEESQGTNLGPTQTDDQVHGLFD